MKRQFYCVYFEATGSEINTYNNGTQSSRFIYNSHSVISLWHDIGFVLYLNLDMDENGKKFCIIIIAAHTLHYLHNTRMTTKCNFNICSLCVPM